MNDFEMLRQVLEFYEGEYKGSADAAIARIEAEVEGAKEHHELHHAEVERLTALSGNLLQERNAAWRQVERLRADAEAWRWLMDNLPEGFDGDGAVEALIVERLAEVERLRDKRDTTAREYQELEAEVERLRARVVKAQEVALAWGDGNNDKMQVALLDLFLLLYGQAPRTALAEEKE